MIFQELTCEHKNERPCFRTFSNGTDHFGFQCVRCGKFRTIKKDVWLKSYSQKTTGPFEQSIADEWQQIQSDHFATQRKENRETVLAGYYSSSEWKRKRTARMRLNQQLFNGFCEMCMRKPATDCHHRDYTRFGNEWLLDLIATCRTCHTSEHRHMQDD